MFRGSLVVGALLLLFGASAVLGIGSMLQARGVAARADAAATGVLAMIMTAVGLGWAPLAAVTLGSVLGVVFAWFTVRTVSGKRRPEGAGRFPAVYGAAVTALSGWALYSAARGGGSVSDHPAHQLGTILGDLVGALLMAFAAMGWLLNAFAVPAASQSHAVPRLPGIREALMAAGLALTFYAIS